MTTHVPSYRSLPPGAALWTPRAARRVLLIGCIGLAGLVTQRALGDDPIKPERALEQRAALTETLAAHGLALDEFGLAEPVTVELLGQQGKQAGVGSFTLWPTREGVEITDGLGLAQLVNLRISAVEGARIDFAGELITGRAVDGCIVPGPETDTVAVLWNEDGVGSRLVLRLLAAPGDDDPGNGACLALQVDQRRQYCYCSDGTQGGCDGYEDCLTETVPCPTPSGTDPEAMCKFHWEPLPSPPAPPPTPPTPPTSQPTPGTCGGGAPFALTAGPLCLLMRRRWQTAR